MITAHTSTAGDGEPSTGGDGEPSTGGDDAMTDFSSVAGGGASPQQAPGAAIPLRSGDQVCGDAVSD